jgi:ATP-dependent RNA helicase DOB1
VEVTLEWCKGCSFLALCKMTDAFEGSIVRTLKRLDELLKQLEKAAAIIGNKDLEVKFKEAQGLLERGIVFAASLYL